MLGRGLTFAIAMLLAASAQATAAQRFAEPMGNGPAGAGGCAEADPCAIEPAIEGSVPTDVVDGDEVVLLPGPYPIAGATLTASDAITIRPRDANTRPTISGTDATVVQLDDAATLRDVRIENTTATGGEAALFVVPSGALVERVVVESTLTGGQPQFACAFFRGTLRDSTCMLIESGPTSFGVALGSSAGGAAAAYTSRFVNVTAGGTGMFTGLLARSLDPNISVSVTAHNVIAPNVIASTDSESGSTAAVSLTNSNYQSSTALGGGTVVTAVGAPTNQSVAPALVDPANGDFHQLAGSETIDGGAPDAFLGALDFDFEPRTQGDAPDIGADEFTESGPPPDGDPPETTINSAPKKKVKTKKRKKKAKYEFAFTASETASFRCSLDGAPAAPCTSPLTGKAKKGKHNFSVFAVDTAGNEDPTPAAYSWKVKRKKRKR